MFQPEIKTLPRSVIYNDHRFIASGFTTREEAQRYLDGRQYDLMDRCFSGRIKEEDGKFSVHVSYL